LERIFDLNEKIDIISLGYSIIFYTTNYMPNKFPVKSTLIAFFYQKILKKILFKIDPEKVHDKMINVGKLLGEHVVGQKLTACLFDYKNEKLTQTILGIKFANPVGLAAGFDKNAELIDILPYVGFGFEEVGSITGQQCAGNSKPRLWRLPESKGLVVHYGLKNNGCVDIATQIKNKILKIPLGISIAKTNCAETVDTEAGIADYVKAYKEMSPIGSYSTINISCPNAFGGEPFTDPIKLDKLLVEIDKIPSAKPIFIKLSPDLSLPEIDALVNVCKLHHISGFISSNLTKKRSNEKIIDTNVPEKGGVSGKVVEELSNVLIKHLYQKYGQEFIIIGCGGVFSAEDAYKKIKLGASLIQMITGMIFEGPQVIGDINRGLVELLDKDGFKNISEAVGFENRQITSSPK